MPFVVNLNATILCAHGGKVTLMPRQTTVTAGGAAVMALGDIMGSPIAGCGQMSATTKPCTTVVATIGGISPKVTAGGKPVHVDSLSGTTDGVPPGTIMVVTAGQTSVQA